MTSQQRPIVPPAHPRRKRSFTLVVLLLAAGSIALPAEADGQGRRGRGQAERLSLSDSLATYYALGIDAHHLCAGLWVVGRDYQRAPETVIAEDISRFGAFRWEDDYTYAVDEATHTATVSDPQAGSRSARYNGDQGCTILPAGTDGVFFEPTTRARPEDHDAREWPSGDLNARATFEDIDHAAIEATLDWAFDDAALTRGQNTRGIVVIHRGRIIAERYAPGWGPYTPQISWSMGKSIAATVIGALVQRGELGLDDPAPLTEWRDPRDPRSAIRVRDLLNMSSGLDFDNFGLNPGSSYDAANEHFRIYFDAVNVAAHSVHQPLRFEPGTVWRYRNSDPLSLMAIARRIVEGRGDDPLSYPQRLVFDRIGAHSFVLETDAWGNFILTGFDYGGTRDWARLGLLYLNNGVWEGERILPEGWAEFVATPAPGDASDGYGGLFWLNRGGAMDGLPADAYWMAGYMGQYTMVIPSADMVVVRHGPSPGGDRGYFERIVSEIIAATRAGDEAASGPKQ